MKPWKMQFPGAGDCGIPGHHKTGVLCRTPASKQVAADRRLPAIASAQTRRQAGREQGLKILAREAHNIKIQAKWLWDCSTSYAALTGTSVSAGALRFFRNTATAESFFLRGIPRV
jgi:hypothetical protein